MKCVLLLSIISAHWISKKNLHPFSWKTPNAVFVSQYHGLVCPEWSWHSTVKVNSSPLVPHICISIGSDRGLLLIQHQAIIQTNVDLFNWTIQNKLQWNCNLTKLHMKISSGKCQPSYPGGHELMKSWLNRESLNCKLLIKLFIFHSPHNSSFLRDYSV